MTEFTVKLADVPVRVQVIHEKMKRFLRDYLTDEPPAFTIRITQEDIQRERAEDAKTRAAEGAEPGQFGDDYLETLALYRALAERLIQRDILLFHGSVIAVDGLAYLFAAKSGTGKSTHTRLWREAFGDRAVMINDDKPLLYIGEEGVRAYGTPWNGKHRLGGNCSAPLKAFCFLTRDSVNHIEEITLKDAFPGLLRQCYRLESGESMSKLLCLLERMDGTVKFYRLGCNMDPEAALVSYRGMQED